MFQLTIFFSLSIILVNYGPHVGRQNTNIILNSIYFGFNHKLNHLTEPHVWCQTKSMLKFVVMRLRNIFFYLLILIHIGLQNVFIKIEVIRNSTGCRHGDFTILFYFYFGDPTLGIIIFNWYFFGTKAVLYIYVKLFQKKKNHFIVFNL